MKVIILGAGISGLATYISLLKYLRPSLHSSEPLSVLIYESHAAPRRSKGSKDLPSNTILGAALGVAPNGLGVLRALNTDLFENVMRQGYPIHSFRFQAARGWHLGDMPCTSFSEPVLPTLLISRQGLWEEIREMVPDDAIVRRTAKVVKWNGDGEPLVEFEDGGEESADLIVGADGVKSVARGPVVGDNDAAKYNAVYEGLCGIGALIPTSSFTGRVPSNQIVITFGPNGFFGYGACSSSSSSTAGSTSVFWSTFSLSDPPSPSNPAPPPDKILAELRARHGAWADPTIRSLINNMTPEAFGSLWPTWTTPVLPTWYKRGVVLTGDAAHALQPTSGQGASQALEDAETLALALCHLFQGKNTENSAQKKDTIDAALKVYQEIRGPKVAVIKKRSEQMGDMKKDKGWFGEMVMYAAMYVMSMILRWRRGSLGMRELYECTGGNEVSRRLGMVDNERKKEL